MLYVSIALIIVSVGMVYLLRSNESGEPHALVTGVLGFSLIPPVILALFTFGVALLIAELGD